MTNHSLVPWLLALAGVGVVISGYLAAFQLGLLQGVWDPFFGDGSERVLTSAISRALPVPDALVGSLGYATDLVLAALFLVTGDRRALLALGAIASLGAITAIGLVVLQPIVVGTLCSLCLLSAAVSIVLALGALLEIRDASGQRVVADHHKQEVPSS